MIQWRQHDRYHLRSDCGKFTVCRTLSGETIAYTAWRVNPRQIIECHVCDTRNGAARDEALRACKAACEGVS